MKLKGLPQTYWLSVWLIMLGSNLAYGKDVKQLTLLEAGDLILKPKVLLGKKVGPNGGCILCSDRKNCVISSTLIWDLFKSRVILMRRSV